MPDISLRFNKDMLVLSSPVEETLARQGVDVDQDLEYMILNEPEAIHDALNLENFAGAQCLVAPTTNLCQAQLAKRRMETCAQDIVKEAKALANSLKPQHLLMEVGPCGLPLDPSSEASLKEHRGQYARAFAQLGTGDFDAVFLNGFDRLEDFQCALDAVAESELDAPVFASVTLNDEGCLASRGTALEEAVACATDHGCSVFGFDTAQDADAVQALVKRVKAACDLPILVQFRVREVNAKAYEPTPDNPYCRPDFMTTAAAKAYAAGAQFLRATGAATPSYSGALVATVMGLDVRL